VTEQPLLTLDNLTVGYDGAAVLSGLNLTLGRGTFAGLLGANGSGKSTLIKTILGIIPPLQGKLRFGGNGTPAVGYVPQREAYDSIYLVSSLEVVLMGAVGRVSPGRRFGSREKEFALQCLEQTGARSLARKRFSHLSGGQKQRVLIARALMTRPDLLVLDEPTAGIDAAAAGAIMQLLETLNRDQGLSVLMVNHDLTAVRKHVREVIWLHQGRVLHGPVAELLSPQKVEEILSLEIG